MQLKERCLSETFSDKDKGDLKAFQTDFETLFLQLSVTIWHLSIRERARKKSARIFEKQRN